MAPLLWGTKRKERIKNLRNVYFLNLKFVFNLALLSFDFHFYFTRIGTQV